MRIESHPLSIVGEMETLEVARSGGIVTVTMNRPHRKNAANGTMWQELLATFREIADSSEDRVMVLTGAGGEFCSGADLTDGGARSAGKHVEFDLDDYLGDNDLVESPLVTTPTSDRMYEDSND